METVVGVFVCGDDWDGTADLGFSLFPCPFSLLMGQGCDGIVHCRFGCRGGIDATCGAYLAKHAEGQGKLLPP